MLRYAAAQPPAVLRRSLRRRCSCVRVRAAWDAREARRVDDSLSRRPLSLDPAGYFLVSVSHEAGEIVAQHYANTINAQGVAQARSTEQLVTL